MSASRPKRGWSLPRHRRSVAAARSIAAPSQRAAAPRPEPGRGGRTAGGPRQRRRSASRGIAAPHPERSLPRPCSRSRRSAGGEP
jgi:hypothetical protein